ncbi:MAG: sigma 54-interacting transcriptional regulator [Negativicutes bacterium]|nr:sigma 54-interacting transcriptional regulator [Negativicutes bacterium]
MTDTEIIAENKLLWRLVDSSYDGIFMTDEQGKIVYFNDSYLRISGLQREKITGRNIIDLVKAKEIPDACSSEVVGSGKPITKVIDYYHGVSALVTSIPILDEEGRLIRVFSNVRDITELLKIQEQLKNTTDLNAEYRRRLWQVEQAGRENNKLVVFSPVMENILRLAVRIAGISSPVLIQGESGVGKDMLARFIHDNIEHSAERPFIQINCSAIPETLLESELFGYEAGAFTGASKKGKLGLFEMANNGTLFLDEIGEMPLAVQVKMLDVLQTSTMYRVGGTKPVRIQSRIIAATNTKLEKLMEEGKFRPDLYYRLNVIPIFIPPLRERPEDLVQLVFHFMEQKNRKLNFTKKIAPQTIDILTRYNWPGNIRELRNVIEQMMIIAEGDILDEKCVPTYITKATGKSLFIETPDYFDSFDLKKIVAEVEREVIIKAIAVFGSLRNTAHHLGLDLSTLVRKKRKYDI